MQWSRAALCQTPDTSVSIPMSCTTPTLQIGRLRLRSQVMIQPALVSCWPLRPLPKPLGTRMVAMGQGEVERGLCILGQTWTSTRLHHFPGVWA